MTETRNSRIQPTEATTFKDIILAITYRLPSKYHRYAEKITDAATDDIINDIIELMPPYRMEAEDCFNHSEPRPILSLPDMEPEPEIFDAKACHRLNRLITRHAMDVPNRWERIQFESPNARKCVIATFDGNVNPDDSFAPSSVRPCPDDLAEAWRALLFARFTYADETVQKRQNTRIENAAKTLMGAGFDERGMRKLNPDEIAVRVRAYEVIITILTANREGLPNANLPSFRESVEIVHELWKYVEQRYPEQFKHPLAPIVEECLQDWNPTTQPERRTSQILPKALHYARTAETQEELPLGLFAEHDVKQQLIIPGMIKDDSSIVPAFPLDVYEASDGKPPERGGKGAPLAQRIWVNALLALPYAKREHDGAWKLTTTLRDIKDWAYPNSWNRTHCLPRIQTALNDVHNMRVYWERRLWNIVQVFAIPSSNIKLDDPLPLLVRLPDGMSGEGAMINVVILRLLGVESAPQFRAWIKLAYIWDDAKRKNNGSRIYALRPQVLRNNRDQPIDARGNIIPAGNWNHEKAVWTGELENNPAAERVTVLDDDDLIRLFFDDKPVSADRRRGRLLTAKKELEDMITRKYVVVQELPEGIRILEPHPPRPFRITTFT